MKWKQLALILILAFFLAQTAEALYDHSYLGFFMIAGANSATRLMTWDLIIALSLIALWMARDARRAGGSYLPFLLVTFGFGVAGPLLYLVVRTHSKRIQQSAAFALLIALCTVSATAWPYADLRNSEARRATPEAAAKGRELLERVAERHGLKAFNNHTTMETVAADAWAGGSPWWPEPVQRYRSQALLGTFSSRVELLDGPRRGEVWGLQAWAPYRRASLNAEPLFLDKPAPEIEFYLPTLQYFAELPFRLLEADVVLHAGTASHRGREYELLFVTWESPEPDPRLDQYVLWVDRQTLLIEMVRYTVREAVALAPESARAIYRTLALGTMHYHDYREVEGVWIPFVQTVTLPEPRLTEYPLENNFFHRLVIEEARFDTVDERALAPSDQHGRPADAKPAA